MTIEQACTIQPGMWLRESPDHYRWQRRPTLMKVINVLYSYGPKQSVFARIVFQQFWECKDVGKRIINLSVESIACDFDLYEDQDHIAMLLLAGA